MQFSDYILKWQMGTQPAKYECTYSDSRTDYLKLQMSLQSLDEQQSCYEEHRQQESTQSQLFLKECYFFLKKFC
jgi:hypothetical protein